MKRVGKGRLAKPSNKTKSAFEEENSKYYKLDMLLFLIE